MFVFSVVLTMLALAMCDSVRFTNAVGRNDIFPTPSFPLFTSPFAEELQGWDGVEFLELLPRLPASVPSP